ncbi:hypothetical protein BpHYR1_034589 [Brachionus plicatilis]|uniref:Uncharacterized protein n=1 Tax=Brachionus plicatilis TaxID=10195 RepID=A0A3M7RFP9_BRAPC|nr:hypothetical protein BpHYR1_034589 [Brachionus plicatilis]
MIKLSSLEKVSKPKTKDKKGMTKRYLVFLNSLLFNPVAKIIKLASILIKNRSKYYTLLIIAKFFD